MKILSILKGVELVIADLEVSLGEQVRSAPTYVQDTKVKLYL